MYARGVPFLLLLAASSTMAQSSIPAEAAIRVALVNWMTHFNTGDIGEISCV
jgi:hypothetical protein